MQAHAKYGHADQFQCKFMDTMLRVGPLCWLMVCFQAGGKPSLPSAAEFGAAETAGDAMYSGYLHIRSTGLGFRVSELVIYDLPVNIQKNRNWHTACCLCHEVTAFELPALHACMPPPERTALTSLSYVDSRARTC